MKNLKNKLIKLGSQNPDLRRHIRPVLDKISQEDDDLPLLDFEAVVYVDPSSDRAIDVSTMKEKLLGSWKKERIGRGFESLDMKKRGRDKIQIRGKLRAATEPSKLGEMLKADLKGAENRHSSGPSLTPTGHYIQDVEMKRVNQVKSSSKRARKVNVLSSLDRIRKVARARKVAKTLITLSHVLGRSKLAFLLDERKINKAVETHFRREGLDLERVPDINWGGLFIGTARNVQRDIQRDTGIEVTEHKYEELLSGALEDILMGEGLDTSGGPWKTGTLADQVKAWLDMGKDKRDMRNLTGNKISQVIRNTFKHHVYNVRQSPTEETVPTKGLQTHERQEDTAKDKSPHGKAFEDRTKIDETNELAKGWLDTEIMNPEDILSEVEDREELQEGMERLTKELDKELKDDPRVYILWKGWKQNPKEKQFSEVLRSEVTYTSPTTGEKHTELVSQALDRHGADLENPDDITTNDQSKLKNDRDKLKDAIQRNWRDVTKYL